MPTVTNCEEERVEEVHRCGRFIADFLDAARRAVAMYRILAAFDRNERAALADLLDRFIESLDEVVGQLAEEERIATAEAANSSETP